MTKTIFILLKKDLLLELRQQHTFFGILLYIASTIFVLFLSMDEPDSTIWNSLFWIIQLFVCVNTAAKYLVITNGSYCFGFEKFEEQFHEIDELPEY